MSPHNTRARAPSARRVFLGAGLLLAAQTRAAAAAATAAPMIYGPVHAGAAIVLLVRDQHAPDAATQRWALHLCEAGTPMLDHAELMWGQRQRDPASAQAGSGTAFNLRTAPPEALPGACPPGQSHVWLRLGWLDGSHALLSWPLAAARPLHT